MSEFVDKDNSACAVCINCVFFVEESSQCLATREWGEVLPYSPACLSFKRKEES